MSPAFPNLPAHAYTFSLLPEKEISFNYFFYMASIINRNSVVRISYLVKEETGKWKLMCIPRNSYLVLQSINFVFCGFKQVMLAILIGLLTILTWHFTRVYTTKSLNNLAYGLRNELLQRPILRMWNILNSTSEITTVQLKLSEYVFKRYSKPATQAEEVEVDC